MIEVTACATSSSGGWVGQHRLRERVLRQLLDLFQLAPPRT